MYASSVFFFKNSKLWGSFVIIGDERISYNIAPISFFTEKLNAALAMTTNSDAQYKEFAEAEYELLTEYKGYSVSIKSNNPDIVDNNGRVVKQPNQTTCVTYTITFTKGNDVQEITLASMVKGIYVDR